MVRRLVEAVMTVDWKQWEGQVIADTFPLQLCLQGDGGHAVFLTEFGQAEPQKAAIKLVGGTPESIEAQLSRWRRVANLSHPNLLRIYSLGRAELKDTLLAYLVMEYAGENLAQVIPVRPLTSEEASQMLEPALSVLAYIHGKGFAHGHVNPGHIMAVGNCLKISIAGVCPIGESAFAIADAYTPPEGGVSPQGDIWSLGVTLVEALTQHLPLRPPAGPADPIVPETLGQPFLEISRQCLRSDPAARPTATRIATLLHPAKHRAIKLSYVLAAAIALVLSVMVVPKFIGRHVAVAPAKLSQPPKAPGTEPAPKVQASPPVVRSQDVILRRVFPDVPERARRTIRGKVKVTVHIRVDESGHVAEARLKSAGPSKYFARLALQAARRWRFAPESDSTRPREWVLDFEFSRAGTKAALVRAARK